MQSCTSYFSRVFRSRTACFCFHTLSLLANCHLLCFVCFEWVNCFCRASFNRMPPKNCLKTDKNQQRLTSLFLLSVNKTADSMTAAKSLGTSSLTTWKQRSSMNSWHRHIPWVMRDETKVQCIEKFELTLAMNIDWCCSFRKSALMDYIQTSDLKTAFSWDMCHNFERIKKFMSFFSRIWKNRKTEKPILSLLHCQDMDRQEKSVLLLKNQDS